jgi:hypothetical protein
MSSVLLYKQTLGSGHGTSIGLRLLIDSRAINSSTRSCMKPQGWSCLLIAYSTLTTVPMPTNSLLHSMPIHSLLYSMPIHSLLYSMPINSLLYSMTSNSLLYSMPINSLLYANNGLTSSRMKPQGCPCLPTTLVQNTCGKKGKLREIVGN